MASKMFKIHHKDFVVQREKQNKLFFSEIIFFFIRSRTTFIISNETTAALMNWNTRLQTSLIKKFPAFKMAKSIFVTLFAPCKKHEDLEKRKKRNNAITPKVYVRHKLNFFRVSDENKYWNTFTEKFDSHLNFQLNKMYLWVVTLFYEYILVLSNYRCYEIYTRNDLNKQSPQGWKEVIYSLKIGEDWAMGNIFLYYLKRKTLLSYLMRWLICNLWKCA